MRHEIQRDSDMGHGHFLNSTGRHGHFLNSTGRHWAFLKSTRKIWTPPSRAPVEPCIEYVYDNNCIHFLNMRHSHRKYSVIDDRSSTNTV